MNWVVNKIHEMAKKMLISSIYNKINNQYHFLISKFHNFHNFLYIIFQKSLSKMSENISPFIQKLQQILNDPQNQSTIRFDECNVKIEIFNKKNLENILSKYFRHGRFQSFVRQLNWYGFYKINSKKTISYSHSQLEKGEKLSSIKSRRKLASQKKKEGPHSTENIQANGEKIEMSQQKKPFSFNGTVASNKSYQIMSSQNCTNLSLGQAQMVMPLENMLFGQNPQLPIMNCFYFFGPL